MSEDRSAIIVGASRGLGLALAGEYGKRGWRMVGTVRGTARTGLHELAENLPGRLEIEQLDITRPVEILGLRERIGNRRFDLLFVNAGVTNDQEETVGDVSTEEFVRVMVTNALSPIRVIEALHDCVSPSGTIGIMSSSLGSVTENDSGSWEVYRGSKAALNTFMRSFAARHQADLRTYLLISPGWVRTDMGGVIATLSVEESIAGVIETITTHAGRAGLAFVDYRGRTVPW